MAKLHEWTHTETARARAEYHAWKAHEEFFEADGLTDEARGHMEMANMWSQLALNANVENIYHRLVIINECL